MLIANSRHLIQWITSTVYRRYFSKVALLLICYSENDLMFDLVGIACSYRRIKSTKEVAYFFCVRNPSICLYSL